MIPFNTGLQALHSSYDACSGPALTADPLKLVQTANVRFFLNMLAFIYIVSCLLS